MKLAFLGLGTMGDPMARRLLNPEHTLTVYNRTASKGDALVELGAFAANSPAEAACGCDVVFSMLADAEALACVSEGPDGALAAMSPGTVWVELSTVGVRAIERLQTQAQAHGVHVLDVPVSGTRAPAEEGRLVLFGGGDPEVFLRVESLLACFGTLVRTGPSGSGAATKLAFNVLGAHMLAGLAAALTLGQTLGLDPHALLQSIGAGSFRSPLFEAKGPRMVSAAFEPADFTMALFLKDQQLCRQTAREHGLSLPTLDAIVDVLSGRVAQGDGALDLSAILRGITQSAPVQPPVAG
ncbi:MAG: NAD(P)-dependent oxidoreductase [Deltaproteobacteria bacterium]|nr:NAD(P)-dependent oxidoreductase [Deltaproteobacteria bacterium]